MSTPTTRTLGLDDWMTPAEVFGPVNQVLEFDLDACATNESCARVPNFISPEQDALQAPWTGKRVWCNPPYGRGIKHWFERAMRAPQRDGCSTVCLFTYANTDTQYWWDWVHKWSRTHTVVFLTRRVPFVRPDGAKSSVAPKGSALIFVGQNECKQARYFYWDWKSEPFPQAVSDRLWIEELNFQP